MRIPFQWGGALNVLTQDGLLEIVPLGQEKIVRPGKWRQSVVGGKLDFDGACGVWILWGRYNNHLMIGARGAAIFLRAFWGPWLQRLLGKNSLDGDEVDDGIRLVNLTWV